MNEIIKVNYADSERPTVMGRELHEALEVKSKYADWFKNMCAYGFSENIDFFTFSKNLENGGRTIDHAITIDMAKEICMIQRSEKGKQFRQYFIEVEKQWNSPEAIMARALKIANNKIGVLEGTVREQQMKIEVLDNENKILTAEALTWTDRDTINAMVRKYACVACNNQFGKAWNIFKKELMYKYGINLNSRITHYLNENGCKTKPKTLDMLVDSETPDALKTIVSMCRENNVNISDLLKKINET